MASARSWLLLVLRRMGEERALVGAAFMVALVAATVAAACVVYPDTMTRRGLLAVLRAADPAAATVLVTADVAPGSAAGFDAEVSAAAGAALGPGAGSLVRTARSESWQLPGGAGMEHPPLTVFAWDDGLEDRTSLVAGAWPGSGSGEQVEAVVTTGTAAALAVGPGSVLEVTSRLDPARRIAVRISGVVAVSNPGDAAWGGDRLALDGAAQPGSFPLRGPLYVGRDALLGQVVVARAALAWLEVPALERIGPDDVASIRAGVAGLASRLEARLGTGRPITVTTGLPAVLDSAGAGILAGRSGTAIIAVQLLVLAAYALVLLASLVVDQRRAASELAAARGAPGFALPGLAAIEGALVALPAVVLGPVLAVALVGLLAGADGGPGGPGPRLTAEAVWLALAAGAVVVVGMVLPTLASLGPVARLRGSLAGRGTRGLAERTGVDLALLVLTGLALWQLRENGTPIARAAGGGPTVDPLLAVAPAMGLLAGGLLALRVGPLIGSWLERPAGGATGTVAPLAARGIARRSFEAGRAALLLVVATGIVLFAAAYGRTWEQSQRDQVAAMIPADLVGRAATGRDVPAAWITRAALLRLPGVGEAVPATRELFAIGAAVPQGVLVGVPTGPAAALMEVRHDLASAPFVDLLDRLVAGRPALAALALPAGTTVLGLVLDATLSAVPGDDGTRRPIPDAWAGLGASVVVQDGLGLLHRLPGATGRVAGGRQELDVPLVARDGTRTARLAAPVAVVAVELELTLPDGVAATGSLRLVRMAAIGAGAGGAPATADVDLGPARSGWGAVRGSFGLPPAAIPVDAGDPLAVTLDEPVTGPTPVVVGFRQADAAALADAPIPVLIDRATRDRVGLAVGDVVPLQRGIGAVLHVRVAGVVEVLPGIAPGPGGALVDLPTLSLVDYANDGSLPSPAEWWLGAAPGATPGTTDLSAAAAGVGTLGLTDVRVRSAVTQDRLDDPLALGSRGALGLAAAAALVFAIVGFAAAAWRSTRTRRPELAVARALGLERGQTAAWLALELGFQLAVGIAGGVVLGILLGWAVLPSVTLTPDGSAPVPAPVVVVPWDLVALAVLAGVGAFAAALLPLRRLGRGDTLAGDLRETTT